MCRGIQIPSLDKESWRLRQEEETSTEDERPKHLNRNGDAIGAGVVTVLSAIVDAGRKQNPNGDAELVTRHDCTPDLLWSDLRHVQDYDGGHESDAKPSNQATCHYET